MLLTLVSRGLCWLVPLLVFVSLRLSLLVSLPVLRRTLVSIVHSVGSVFRNGFTVRIFIVAITRPGND